jgi:NADPH:quinone reductase-like Zn-dependent oxidoreductase
MRAIVQKAYGSADVLEVKQLATPTPADNEILVKVHASSVTAVDCTFRGGRDFFARMFTGLLRPKRAIPGGELAGQVTAVGKNVSAFKTGDEVFGPTADGFGAHAELVCVPEASAFLKRPDQLSADQAAVVSYGGLTALPFMRDEAKVRAGQRVLINGASGPVGATALQLAKLYGAEVTGVCSTANVELVRSLGADEVIDYTREDFTRRGQVYDLIFDPAGKSTFGRCKGSLTRAGKYLSAVLAPGILWHTLWTSVFGKKKAKVAFTGLRPPADKKKDLAYVAQLVLDGKLKFPIAERYPLERIGEAHRRVEQGHRGGNVVVTVGAA